MGLEERHLPTAEKVKLPLVIVSTTDRVADFRQTSCRRQTDITSANH
jgi:hypothetical protein